MSSRIISLHRINEAAHHSRDDGDTDRHALHAIATGNMLPAFVTEKDGSMRELPTICVDSSEFVVSKLKDRGTHQAFGVVTNAQDFMHILRLYVERELTDRQASKPSAQTSTVKA